MIPDLERLHKRLRRQHQIADALTVQLGVKRLREFEVRNTELQMQITSLQSDLSNIRSDYNHFQESTLHGIQMQLEDEGRQSLIYDFASALHLLKDGSPNEIEIFLEAFNEGH